MVDTGIRMAERLGRVDLAELCLSGFEALEPRDGGAVYVVARTEDDLEECGATISGEASA